MKTIVVATDFSPAADNAANYAAQMALAINAKLLLLHVYQVPVVYLEVPELMTVDEMEKNTATRLNVLKEELDVKTNYTLNIETEFKTGVFFAELKAVCEKINPYTVVMGSQGTTSTARLLFGSHTVNAMKHLEWPLITVPPEIKFNAIKKIGLACDFDKVVDNTPVDEIKILVHDFNAELHVLNTGKQKVFNPNIVFESGLLQEMLADLKPSYHFTTNPNTDEGIMDFSERNHLDLLLVLPKRHTLIESLVHKSHTKQLVLHSHVPVMALHL
jgi:nucleotide-binding universal stress UspA family protein